MKHTIALGIEGFAVVLAVVLLTASPSVAADLLVGVADVSPGGNVGNLVVLLVVVAALSGLYASWAAPRQLRSEQLNRLTRRPYG